MSEISPNPPALPVFSVPGHSDVSPRIRGERTAIVLGGGIHGVTAALALADMGLRVTVVDRAERFLQGTSAATHNRAHLGYHYARSVRTAKECFDGLRFFRQKYPESLFFPKEAYYVVEKESNITPDQFAHFCEEVRIPFTRRWPSTRFLDRDRLSESFLVPEPCFNLNVLRRALEKELAAEVTTYVGWNVVEGRRQKGLHRIVIERQGTRRVLESDFVVNATYAYSNNILDRCDLAEDRTEYRYDTTEVIVARSKTLRSKTPCPAMTVIDGPYVSLMPLAGSEDLLLLYDVVHSVFDRREGLLYKRPTELKSNREKMFARAAPYFPIAAQLEYVESLWGARPLPLKNSSADRFTRIMAHRSSPGFFSILEGKFISAPLVAQQLVQEMQTKQLI